jgi:hypothetical protein
MEDISLQMAYVEWRLQLLYLSVKTVKNFAGIVDILIPRAYNCFITAICGTNYRRIFS